MLGKTKEIFLWFQISALDVDHQGARVAVGGYDYKAKLFDFAGMDASFKAFREFQPVEA